MVEKNRPYYSLLNGRSFPGRAAAQVKEYKKHMFNQSYSMIHWNGSFEPELKDHRYS